MRRASPRSKQTAARIKLRGETIFAREHAVIERQVDHVMHLVDDLLDVSRVSRGKIELKTKQVDLRDPIAKAVEIATPLVDRNQHQLHLDVPAIPRATGTTSAPRATAPRR